MSLANGLSATETSIVCRGDEIAKANKDLLLSEVEPITAEPSLSIYSNFVTTTHDVLAEQMVSGHEVGEATPESPQETTEPGLAARGVASPMSQQAVRARGLHVRPPQAEVEWLASQWFFESDEEPEEIPPP